MHKTISFVILLYKQKNNIKKILNSIYYSQIPRNEYEIIFIDNNSNDNCNTEIEKYKKNIEIKFYNNLKIQNQSASRNIGISYANGKYILFLDGDDYFIPISLYKIFSIIKHNNGIDIFFLNRYYEDNNLKKIICFDLNNIDSAGICYYAIKKSFLINNNIYFDEEKYYYYSEDIVFLSKILNTSFSYIEIPKNIVHYYGKKDLVYNNISNIKNSIYYYDMYNNFSLNKKSGKYLLNIYKKHIINK